MRLPKKTDLNDAVFISESLSVETRTFETSSINMISVVLSELEKYPQFEPERFKNYQGTITCWFSGEFTMGTWTHTTDVGGLDEKTQSHSMYEVSGSKFTYALLAQPHLFASNIGSLLLASPAIQRYIGIPVRVIGRVLYFLEDADRFVVAPYLILESERTHQ